MTHRRYRVIFLPFQLQHFPRLIPSDGKLYATGENCSDLEQLTTGVSFAVSISEVDWLNSTFCSLFFLLLFVV